MARLPNCCACKYYNFGKGDICNCQKYAKGIPTDILLEYKECKYFLLKPYDADDSDLPLAKGW